MVYEDCKNSNVCQDQLDVDVVCDVSVRLRLGQHRLSVRNLCSLILTVSNVSDMCDLVCKVLNRLDSVGKTEEWVCDLVFYQRSPDNSDVIEVNYHNGKSP